MTKEITKAEILQEIQDKFKLREFIPANFLFDETVVPIYNIEPHLAKAEIKSYTQSITSGPAAYWFLSPAQNEQWTLHGYNVIFKTGSYTVAGLMIYRPVITYYFYIDLNAAQSVSYAHNLPKDIIVKPGEGLFLYVDGYTSTGDLELRADVTVEEIR